MRSYSMKARRFIFTQESGAGGDAGVGDAASRSGGMADGRSSLARLGLMVHVTAHRIIRAGLAALCWSSTTPVSCRCAASGHVNWCAEL